MTKLNQDRDGSVAVLQARKPGPQQTAPVEPKPALNAVCQNDFGARWTSAMLCGDFSAAWTISDEVLRRRVESDQDCRHWPRHLQYVWRGGALRDKRILVRCYHGLGDTIQFIRFAALLRNLARHTVFWVQPELLELARAARGVDQAIPLHEGAPDVAYDLDIEIMELPHALRITPEMLADNVPYLFAGNAGAASSRKRVGLVWRAGKWNPCRSIPVELLMRLREVAGLELVSLQFDAAPAELAAMGAVDWRSAGIHQLATRVMTLDLVITVDTMTAHLAGALGRPVWILLPAACDWRWMEDRSDSPWYPSMRLFRQRQAGHWREVLDNVIAELTRGP
jgi:hypothetical protein